VKFSRSELKIMASSELKLFQQLDQNQKNRGNIRNWEEFRRLSILRESVQKIFVTVHSPSHKRLILLIGIFGPSSCLFSESHKRHWWYRLRNRAIDEIQILSESQYLSDCSPVETWLLWASDWFCNYPRMRQWFHFSIALPTQVRFRNLAMQAGWRLGLEDNFVRSSIQAKPRSV
jgi:hypothetical protein